MGNQNNMSGKEFSPFIPGKPKFGILTESFSLSVNDNIFCLNGEDLDVFKTRDYFKLISVLGNPYDYGIPNFKLDEFKKELISKIPETEYII